MHTTTFSIALIPGDGIGCEVTLPAFAIAQKTAASFGATLSATTYDWGSDYYFKNGRMMPADAIETLQKHHAILLGAVGHTEIPDHVTLNGLLLPIRRALRSIRQCAAGRSVSRSALAAQRARPRRRGYGRRS